jgi:hypothetical protein
MKIGHILLILVVVVVVIAGVLVFTNSGNEEVKVPDTVVQEDNNVNVEDEKNNVSGEGLNIKDVTELTSFVDKVYEGLELFPSIASMELMLDDAETVTYETGLSSTDKIDAVVVSAPMISSQAYSMILVKVKDGVDADSVAKEMSENINPNKWICVSAEKIYATSSGNVAFLVMTNADMAEDVYNNFKKEAGKIGPEYSKDNVMEDMPMEDDMMIPAL